MSKYIPTIGIETHVQLKTKTKLFAAVDNDAKNAPPNTLISHICVGMPGALPVLNSKAVELCVQAAYALNTKPQKFSKFDRKHYFYPDLPKGYQISQYDQPIILGGHVEIRVGSQIKKIGIVRAHLEEDAGKNTHPDGADYSLVDLNRAGTPLLEIVSEPQIHSAAEAKAYVRELYLIMKYAGISDCDLYLGHMRFDVNVSLSTDPSKLGTRAEIKNLNSFKSVENAINYEIERQAALLEKGEKVQQETRGWDEAKQKTTSQRGKEEAHDYRYMPEPDIPPIVLSDEELLKIQATTPELPKDIRRKLSGLDVNDTLIEEVLDNVEVYEKISKVSKLTDSSDVIRRIAYDSLEKPDSLKLDPKDHIKVANAVISRTLSSSSANLVLGAMVAGSTDSVDELISQNQQVSDKNEIEKIVADVLANNQKAANDVKNGELKAIGFLVGQVMARSKGKANPELAQQIIKKQLEV